jgi:hypothetical protein
MRRALSLVPLPALILAAAGCGGEPAGVPARAPAASDGPVAAAAPPPAAKASSPGRRAERKTKPANLARGQID